jgi:hypothetical protein
MDYITEAIYAPYGHAGGNKWLADQRLSVKSNHVIEDIKGGHAHWQKDQDSEKRF